MTRNALISSLEETITTVQDFPIPGIKFKDISPIFLQPKLYRAIVEDLAAFSHGKIDAVCGIESRGYLFGMGIAEALDVPFVLIRKKGKLPPPFVGIKYDLEYGSAEIEMKTGHLKPGQKVLIHDDLLATGGTAAAAAALVEKESAKAVQFSFLITLNDLMGKEKLAKHGVELYSVLNY